MRLASRSDFICRMSEILISEGLVFELVCGLPAGNPVSEVWAFSPHISTNEVADDRDNDPADDQRPTRSEVSFVDGDDSKNNEHDSD